MGSIIGQSIGRYHIIDKLGEGGMAVVYKAYDTHLECEVAVKVIRTENILPSALEKTLQRFDREAKAVAKLNHPNIVSVTDYGSHDGMPYLVMPYIPGGTLKRLLDQKGRLFWRQALELILPIADALEYAHSQHIIHRDVKPSNILLTQTGQPMLSDFGVAKVVDADDAAELTGTMITIGTPEYMAPEQVNSKHVDARVDIYALGIVLYEMVTGRRPFTADTPMAVMIMHSRDPLPRPSSFVPDLPAELEHVFYKALAKAPEERYAAMADFKSALEGLLGQATSKVAATQPVPVIPPIPVMDVQQTMQTFSPAATYVQPPSSYPYPPQMPPGYPPQGMGYPPQYEEPKRSSLPIILTVAGLVLVVVVVIIVSLLKGASGGGSPSGVTYRATHTDAATEVIKTSQPGNRATATKFPTQAGQQVKLITPTPYSAGNCHVDSHIKVGDLVYVSLGGGANSIRSTPDTHPSNNIIAKAYEGDVMLVVGGPECDGSDYLMWFVQPMYTLDWKDGGWTPEVAKTIGEYWLVPVPYWDPCGSGLVSHLKVGDRAYVSAPGDPNRVRSDAGLSYAKEGTIPPGGKLSITGGPRCTDGMIWWNVSGDNGISGWTVEGDGSNFWLIPIIN
jgi:serine/threonine protein kinase